MRELLKEVIKDKKRYSEEYWDAIKTFAYNEDNDFERQLISYLSKVTKENALNEDSELAVLIIQYFYPFKDEQISELTASVSNVISSLSLIHDEDLEEKRDYLLYCLVDAIFHNPEMVCDVNESARESLVESILKMSNLTYDTSIEDSRSYFKNYKVIQFINYLKDEKSKNKLIKSYLNHFDARVKEDMKFEIEEEKKYQKEKNKNK